MLTHNRYEWFVFEMPIKGETPMANFLTVKQTAQRFPAFSEASLRFYIFHEKTNGLTRAIRRIGRKILIHELFFVEWLEGQNGGAK